ncbi:MAG: hypothetical protein ACE5I5_16300, partial [Candidatus Heimdallarchaeota archaeon]
IKWHIAEMKRRFYLYRLIEVDYYKLGLSELYLVIRGFQDLDIPSKEFQFDPISNRYPLRAETFKTGLAKQYVAFQSYTPPWGRRYDFLHECKMHVQKAGVEFLTGEPDFFIATGRRVFYNLKSFDYKMGRWKINLRDLRFLINNYLMTGSLGVFPPYDIQFDVNRRQGKQDVIEFDSLDLRICEQFWNLEGKNNRFATTHAVSKALDEPYKEVRQRYKRLRKEQVINFYYWTDLGLSSAFTTLLITKDEFILNNFQSILAELPVSSVISLRSLSDKELRGLLCYTYLPTELTLGPLFQSTFFAEEGVLGFCAQRLPPSRPSRPLYEYYDPVRKWWKWDQLENTKEVNIQEECSDTPGEYPPRYLA